MKLIPILLRGNLEEKLNFNFGALYPVTNGEWEMCIKTFTVSYTKSSPSDPNLPNVDKFVRLSSNYVESLSFDESQTKSVTIESVLAIIRLKLKDGQKQLLEFPQRDFFFISAPSQKLYFNISNSDGSPLNDSLKKHLNIQILVLFRRRS